MTPHLPYNSDLTLSNRYLYSLLKQYLREKKADTFDHLENPILNLFFFFWSCSINSLKLNLLMIVIIPQDEPKIMDKPSALMNFLGMFWIGSYLLIVTN